MTKFYRVKKDNFLWKEGAILKQDESESGYEPVTDIWNVLENQTEYITSRVIENNSEWFERVYEVNGLTKAIYLAKDKAIEYYNKNFQE